MEPNSTVPPSNKRGPMVVRSCDTCRIRKLRCDRGSPCSNCRVHKFTCNTTPRARRNRSSVPQNQPVTSDSVQANLLQPGKPIISASATASILSSPRQPERQAKSPFSEPDEGDSDVFEGASSLHAHSVAAQELFVQALNDNAFAARNPEMAAAVSSLRQIATREKSKSDAKTPGLTRLPGRGLQALYKLALPPTDVVLDLLRRAKENPTICFASGLSFVTLEQATDLCQAVFFNIDDYTNSTAIIVHGTLYNLFTEFKWAMHGEAQRQRYGEYISLCRTNLECSISHLELLLPATFEVIQALLIGATFTIEISKMSICRKLTATACSLAQTLGWHRHSSMKDNSVEVKRQKLVMFWSLYFIDKTMSLRLGQASTIQDYDIDVPMPSFDEDSSYSNACARLIGVWSMQARIQSLTYQQLYSPGALQQGDYVRIQNAQFLLRQCENMRVKYGNEDEEQHDFPASLMQYTSSTHSNIVHNSTDVPAALKEGWVVPLIDYSDEVIYYTMLTLIYRGTPSANQDYNPSEECLCAARKALERHHACAKMYKDGDDEMWSLYLQWTVLNAPFIPFTVVFCNVLTTVSRSDLSHLGTFVDTLARKSVSEAAQNMHRLTSVFYRVAKLYVEAKEQETCTSVKTQQQQAYQDAQQFQSLMPFSPYLNALGFSGEPTVDSNSMANANLGDWFSGNQYMMGLLEHDLSYLDSWPS